MGTHDFFVSYAREDNEDGWISMFLDELARAHARFFPNHEPLNPFFDKVSIPGGADWRLKLQEGISSSSLFVAFISPSYMKSEWCRIEWTRWMEHEIALHILSEGVRPFYIVEVPGLLDGPPPAGSVVEGLLVTEEGKRFVHLVGRRNFKAEYFLKDGLKSVQIERLREVLDDLAQDVQKHHELVRLADKSHSTVPAYNERFTGRLDELWRLRDMLVKEDRTGVICGLQGLGGIGKTELAFAYSHAFASAYPGGRFLIRCEGRASLREALLSEPGLTDLFAIPDEIRADPPRFFVAVLEGIRRRMDELGPMLLVLDNVTERGVVSKTQTDEVTVVGPKLHILATTRLPPPGGPNWLSVDRLPDEDALALLTKFRPFADEGEEIAARSIVKRLGGFTLAVELVGGYLVAHPDYTSYASLAVSADFEKLECIGADPDIELRRKDEHRLSAILSPVLESLSEIDDFTMLFVSLMPPDQIPMPWLREIVGLEKSEVLASEESWGQVCERLEKFALITRITAAGGTQKFYRTHRMVQDAELARIQSETRRGLKAYVAKFVLTKLYSLGKEAEWQTAEWEIVAGEAYALYALEHPDDYTFSIVMASGYCLRETARWSSAESLLRRALAALEKIHGSNHPDVATNLNNLALLLTDLGRHAEAEPYFWRALSIDESILGPEHPNVATDLGNLALLLQDTHRLVDAEPLLRRALAIDVKAYGADHPNIAARLINLSGLLRDTDRLPEAEPLLRRALQINEKHYGTENPMVALSLNSLALLLNDTNRPAEAEPMYRRALSIDEKCFGPYHPRVATRLNNLGSLIAAYDLSEAEPMFRRALAIDEKSLGPSHPAVALRLKKLAGLLDVTNRLEEAESMYRRALAIEEQSSRPANPKQ